MGRKSRPVGDHDAPVAGQDAVPLYLVEDEPYRGRGHVPVFRQDLPRRPQPLFGDPELVPLGHAQAAVFTWERAADALEALWRELA